MLAADRLADRIRALWAKEWLHPFRKSDAELYWDDLGEHRLLCGDATRMAEVEEVLAGGLADMVFTDPPYNVDYEGKTARKLKIGNDALGGGFQEFLCEASANMLAACKGAIYMCMSSSELHTLHQAFRDAGGHWSTFLIWAKHHFTLGRSDYQRMYEPILYGWRKGADHFWCGARDQGDVWFIKRPASSREHPTMKPVELVERAIRNSSKTRDTVLDPFGGSGTTLFACEKTGLSRSGAPGVSSAARPHGETRTAAIRSGRVRRSFAFSTPARCSGRIA
jgi:DNA modification methylase